MITIILPNATEAKTTPVKINSQLSTIEAQKKKAKQDQAQTLQKLSSIKQEKDTAIQEANQLQSELDASSAQLTKLETQLSLLEDELQNTSDSLQDTEKRVSVRKTALNAVLRSMYQNDTGSYLQVLLGSTSFSDFFERMNDLTAIGNKQKELLSANEKDQKNIEQDQQTKQKEVDQKNTLIAKAEETKDTLIPKEKKKEVMIASLNSQVQDLEELNAEQEKEMMHFAEQESKLISQSKQAALTYTGGKIAWPFAKNYPITSPFGDRIDPINGSKAFHPGIDIGAPKGTDILAAEDGVVIVAQWYGGYGNCVIIDHGKGLKTLYGHMLNDTMMVKKGDTVKRGQKIGEVGMTGRATGYHLHFGVYEKDQAVPPFSLLQ
jgi:murein DD-endopeptidase MepM/ murein hydrolase activator NlpD